MVDLPGPEFAIGGELAGMDTVVATLRQETFPLDKEALYYAIGDVKLRTKNNDEVFAREVLDRVDGDWFETIGEAVSVITETLEVMSLPH
jgi:hypothetical protein